MRLVYLLIFLVISSATSAADSRSSNARGSVGQVVTGVGEASTMAVIVPVLGAAVVSMGVSLAVSAASDSTRPVIHAPLQPNTRPLPISPETVTAVPLPANKPTPKRQNEAQPTPSAKP